MRENFPKAGIITGPNSDHDIPYIILKVQDIRRGPGFWKLNTGLLDDPEYCVKIRQIISDQKTQKFETPAARWDYYKV